MSKSKYDLAVWHHSVDGETYAFPIGAKDAWGGVIYPALNDPTWDYRGTLPKGVEVADPKRVKGNRVKAISPGRRASDKGRQFAASHPTPLSEDAVKEIASSYLGTRLRPTADEEAGSLGPNVGGDDGANLSASPDYQLEQALAELHDTVVDELLEMVASASPKFETLVLDLLHAMGYGTSRSDLQRVGGSGDGGSMVSSPSTGLAWRRCTSRRSDGRGPWDALRCRPSTAPLLGNAPTEGSF